jgi:hypothetical protein
VRHSNKIFDVDLVNSTASVFGPLLSSSLPPLTLVIKLKNIVEVRFEIITVSSSVVR